MELLLLLARFDEWAKSAPREYDGWESAFPEWSELIRSALELMRELEPGDAALVKAVARVWEISEETEDLADAIRRNPDGYGVVLRAVCREADWRGRFQIYTLASVVPELGVEFAKQGLADESGYVVGRSLLALDEIDRGEAEQESRKLVDSDDEYVRRVARGIVRCGG